MTALLISHPAAATGFAVLLGGQGSGDEPVAINNPLYEETNQQGENPLYEPSSMIFSPPQLTTLGPALLTVNFDESITEDVPPPPAGGFVFELLLEDEQSGVPIIDFAAPIDLRFRTPRLDRFGDRAGEGLAISYFDSTAGQWLVEDDALAVCDNGTLCGKTDHFTVFAIGPNPIPEPSALLIGATGAVLCFAQRRVR